MDFKWLYFNNNFIIARKTTPVQKFLENTQPEDRHVRPKYVVNKKPVFKEQLV
jgi:hypothetical protein